MKLSKEARELVARMTEDAALWEMLEAQANELGQAFIGGEGHLMAAYGCNAEELEDALNAITEARGFTAVIGGLDGNHPGDWFMAALEMDAPERSGDIAGEILAGWTGMTPEEVVKRYAEAPSAADEAAAWMAGRLEALMIMPMDHLKALAISLGVAETELTTRYAAAREIIWAEDQYPIWRWFDPIQVEIILADRPPCRDGIVRDVIGYKAGRLGHAWDMARQAAQASTNVREWRNLGPCGFRLIGLTDAECDAALGYELDASPF